MYENSREQREKENKEYKNNIVKVLEYINYLKRDLIEKNICSRFKDHINFNVQYCLNECGDRECIGKKKINYEFTKVEEIRKEIERNQIYINRDRFYN